MITTKFAVFQKVKQCSKCRKEKVVSLFYKDKSSKDGLMAWCSECVKQNDLNRALREITQLKKGTKSTKSVKSAKRKVSKKKTKKVVSTVNQMTCYELPTTSSRNLVDYTLEFIEKNELNTLSATDLYRSTKCINKYKSIPHARQCLEQLAEMDLGYMVEIPFNGRTRWQRFNVVPVPHSKKLYK